jgi:hypothetical protein
MFSGESIHLQHPQSGLLVIRHAHLHCWTQMLSALSL